MINGLSDITVRLLDLRGCLWRANSHDVFIARHRPLIKPRRMPPPSIVLFGFMPLAAMLLVGLFGPSPVDRRSQSTGSRCRLCFSVHRLSSGADNLDDPSQPGWLQEHAYRSELPFAGVVASLATGLVLDLPFRRAG
ncbi:hypothetical protein [Agrobacterium tumefaciens]|uniref:hypothetical protein n=1 Tax=Agrobacterium tumefaciens TaxID=358 RepID=UPI0021CF0651|nr:hypothetical protein [Agrobacterium tumefaciens]UXS66695.1 hypothetical protein FY147_27615 [Agrobacterium tumefaciens]